MSTLAIQEPTRHRCFNHQSAANDLSISQLTNEHKAEVLRFLSKRPIHTVCMASLIRDNNLISNFNRGIFYAHRDEMNKLDGVALIGHATLVQARTERAFAAFASLTENNPAVNFVVGEQHCIKRFYRHFKSTSAARKVLNFNLLEQRYSASSTHEAIDSLRLATLNDLLPVMRATAQMIFDERGVNPMDSDPDGFRQRCARRIRQQRVWVWMRKDHLIFKADVLAQTPEVSYLEGVYVDPRERGKGYGLRCLSQAIRHLLTKSAAVSLLVDKDNYGARMFYAKAGFTARSRYNALFTQQQQ